MNSGALYFPLFPKLTNSSGSNNLSPATKSDLNYIVSTIVDYSKILGNGANKNNYNLVVIRRVPPGTTEKLLIPLLEENSKMKAGMDFGVCMQPEFLRSVTSAQEFNSPRVIVIGEYDKYSGAMLEALYKFVKFDAPIVRVDLQTAEFIKYIGNYFNATKISFANEIWNLGKKLGIDPNLSVNIAVDAVEGFGIRLMERMEVSLLEDAVYLNIYKRLLPIVENSESTCRYSTR